MKDIHLAGVPSLRAAKALAKRLGITVTPVTGTGEWRFHHHDFGTVTFDNRKKDANGRLRSFLRHVGSGRAR